MAGGFAAASLADELPDMGRDVAIDASDMPAYANGQRFLSKNGPERERYSDPDASWGHRSAVSTRKGGGFYGYRLHAAVCAVTGLPLAWRVASAREHESLSVLALLDTLNARGFKPATAALDMGYDVNPVLRRLPRARRCSRDSAPQDHRGKPASRWVKAERRYPLIPRETRRFRDLYAGRAAVEREFGRLKMDYALTPLRTHGIERVALNADLSMLARLSQRWRERAPFRSRRSSSPRAVNSRAAMSYTASEQPWWRRGVTYIGAVVAVSLVILLVLDILDQGETLAGDIVFWTWFVSAVALLVLGLGILLSRTSVRLGALAAGLALFSFGLWALVTVAIL